MQKLELRLCGKYVAMSILQGGPAFPVFSLTLYEYMCTRECHTGLTISTEDVLNDTVFRLLKQVLARIDN